MVPQKLVHALVWIHPACCSPMLGWRSKSFCVGFRVDGSPDGRAGVAATDGRVRKSWKMCSVKYSCVEVSKQSQDGSARVSAGQRRKRKEARAPKSGKTCMEGDWNEGLERANEGAIGEVNELS